MAFMKSIVELHTNKLNDDIYDPMDPESAQFKELAKSIQESGILQPIVVRSSGLILSGHRRFAVAQSLGLTQVPVEIKDDGDERQLIVEFNRYRTKTLSELMREAETLKAYYRENVVVHHKPGPGSDLPPEEKINVRTEVSATIGMGERTFAKAEKIFKLAKENPNAAAKLKAVDEGRLSIDSAFKSLRTLMAEPDAEDAPEIPDIVKFYNSWQFSENDPRFGMPHPGRIPGQIPANIIYYYTEPGDLVVDPMAGGGSTLDAAEYLDRRCLGYDVFPKRPDIQMWDIEKGFPEEAVGCDLIFMDPPYWNMIDEGYTDASASRKSLTDFMVWYKALLRNAGRTVKVGGFVAVINMGQYFRLPPDFEDGYIDWPIFTYMALLDGGLRPWARVGVTYPTTLHGGFDVDAAKKGRFMLPILGDIIVMRRMK